MGNEEYIYVPEQVPLFPLPQVVLFPGTLLPLHVFEPRYREMTADALAGPPVIAVALLKPGFEPLYYTPRAPIYDMVSVAHIVQHEQLEDGNYNVLLRGVTRARILEEDTTEAYRVARIEPVETFCGSGLEKAQELYDELSTVVRSNTGLDPELRKHWLRLFGADLELDELTDLLAAGLPSEPELRQCLLDEPDAATRAVLLSQQIRTLAAVGDMRRRMGATGDESLN